MRDTVEEEKLRDVECLDQHGEASCDYHGEADDVDNSDDIEDDITRAREGFIEEGHCLDV